MTKFLCDIDVQHCGACPACERNKSSASPAGSIAWSTEAPNKEDDYWWWNGDEDGPPIFVSVLMSGTNGKCFAAMGQHGWNRAQWVDDMGGHWMKAIIPEPPSN